MNLDLIETAAQRHAGDLHWEGADIAYQTHVTPDVVVEMCALIRKQETFIGEQTALTAEQVAIISNLLQEKRDADARAYALSEQLAEQSRLLSVQAKAHADLAQLHVVSAAAGASAHGRDLGIDAAFIGGVLEGNEAAPQQHAQAAQGETEMLRDVLAIQEACGLHTDEYAPGSVIEYIKELEAENNPPAKKPISKEWCERMVKAEIEADVNIEAGNAQAALSDEPESYDISTSTLVRILNLGGMLLNYRAAATAEKTEEFKAVILAAIQDIASHAAAPAIQQEGAALGILLRECLGVLESVPTDYVIDLAARIGVALASPAQPKPAAKLDDGYTSSDMRMALATLASNAAPVVAVVQPKPPADAAPVEAKQHPDDIAVDRFAVAMKHKMAVSRDKGRGGWNDEAQCTMEALANMLVSHIAKGDPVDIANFAMMLHQREAAAMEHHPCYGNDAARALKAAAAVQQGSERDAALGNSLLRPAISAANPLPAGCYCKPGSCSAPVIMGRQTPCRDPQKAAAKPPTPPAAADSLETSELDALPYDGKDRT